MSKLIIFDCDGTLVDSETLYNTITSELLVGLGFPQYTPQKCIELFGGLSWSTIKNTLEQEHGPIIPRDIIDQYIRVANDRMETGLKNPAGTLDVLTALQDKADHDICVASNGERNNVIKSLNVTGLSGFFPDHNIFTKIQVERPKPAPDLFLFTADKMKYTPEQCLVIEDSIAGVQAAKAANMTVIGFTGCAHAPAEQEKLLMENGADITLHDFIHILDHI